MKCTLIRITESKHIKNKYTTFLFCFYRGSECSMFQKLVFLIRDFPWIHDFPLGYHDESTPDPNYKRARLNPQEGKFDKDRNYIREQISVTFPQVSAYLLPYPGNGLVIYEKLNKLEEDFSEHLKNFVEVILSPDNLSPKRIDDAAITGEGFKPFVQAWTRLFRDKDQLATMHSIHDVTAQVQHVLAIKDAVALYESEMRKAFESAPDGFEDKQFLEIHSRFSDSAFQIFKKFKKLGGKKFDDEFGEELGNNLASQYDKYLKINLDRRNTAEERRQMIQQKKKVERDFAQSKVSQSGFFFKLLCEPYSLK
jgi:atlastin